MNKKLRAAAARGKRCLSDKHGETVAYAQFLLLAVLVVGLRAHGVWAEDAKIEWAFDQPSDLLVAQHIREGRVTNGLFTGFAAWDPQIVLCCPENGIDAARLTWLTARLYSSDEADQLDVYYASPDGCWCLGGKLPIRKGWATYRLDLNNNAWRETEAGTVSKQWGGSSKRVNAFRLDPGNQAGRWIRVDRICLEPTLPDFEEGVTADPRGTAELQTLRVPKAVEAGGTMDVSADFKVSVPKGMEKGTVFFRIWQGTAVQHAQEQSVAFSNTPVTASATFPVSRYWNTGTLTVETGIYELDVTDSAPVKAEIAFTNSRVGRLKPPVCELRQVGGDAALFVNGKPFPGYLYSVEGAPRLAFHRELAQTGVHLYSGWFGFSHCGDMGHIAPDTYDYSEYDRSFASILETNPDAWFLPHIGLTGPLWWQQAHPEELSLNEDGTRNPTSFASERWKHDMGEDLRKLLTYLRQSPYADRIIGYLLFSGATCEWQMWGTWKPSRDDYSAPALRAFRAFLAKRYGGDARLRAAWADGTVTLASADMPRGTQRHPEGPQVFRDPATECQTLDFYAFISSMTADAILHFARIAREATAGQALVGTYYAYLTAHGVNQQDSGHLAAQRVFDSPDIDFLTSPPNYAFRNPGETSLFMSATDSFRMRGKLWLDESDHRTFLSDLTCAEYSRASTLEETLGVFRREFAQVLTKRAAVSWLDMSGDWFAHPAILGEMGRQAEVMRQSLPHRKPFAPEVGVFVDPESFYWMRSTEANAALVLRQVVTLPQAGFPWDFCLLSDLADARMPDYKLYLFLNAFRVDAARREAIRRKLRRNNATALFVYAPGYFSSDGASLDNMRALTGIRIAKDEAEGRPQILLDPKWPLAQGLTSGEPLGAKELTVAPLFYANDPGARVIGRLVGNQRAGLVMKRMDGWTSIYSAAMTLPPTLVRQIARQAGVHIWLETDDALYTDGQFLGIHAASDSTKQVKLPSVCTVVDAMSGKPLPVKGRTVSLDMKKAETVLWQLRK